MRLLCGACFHFEPCTTNPVRSSPDPAAPRSHQPSANLKRSLSLSYTPSPVPSSPSHLHARLPPGTLKLSPTPQTLNLQGSTSILGRSVSTSCPLLFSRSCFPCDESSLRKGQLRQAGLPLEPQYLHPKPQHSVSARLSRPVLCLFDRIYLDTHDNCTAPDTIITCGFGVSAPPAYPFEVFGP